ncbi:hypothetical protein ABIA33_007149 [Streptacidiphilus sp. MAP12-16]
MPHAPTRSCHHLPREATQARRRQLVRALRVARAGRPPGRRFRRRGDGGRGPADLDRQGLRTGPRGSGGQRRAGCSEHRRVLGRAVGGAGWLRAAAGPAGAVLSALASHAHVHARQLCRHDRLPLPRRVGAAPPGGARRGHRVPTAGTGCPLAGGGPGAGGLRCSAPGSGTGVRAGVRGPGQRGAASAPAGVVPVAGRGRFQLGCAGGEPVSGRHRGVRGFRPTPQRSRGSATSARPVDRRLEHAGACSGRPVRERPWSAGHRPDPADHSRHADRRRTGPAHPLGRRHRRHPASLGVVAAGKHRTFASRARGRAPVRKRGARRAKGGRPSTAGTAVAGRGAPGGVGSGQGPVRLGSCCRTGPSARWGRASTRRYPGPSVVCRGCLRYRRGPGLRTGH